MKGVSVPANIIQNEAYAGPEGFTFEYRMQNDPNAAFDAPVGAGTYDLVVKRPGITSMLPLSIGTKVLSLLIRRFERWKKHLLRRSEEDIPSWS